MISSPPISEVWCANQINHASAWTFWVTSCHWIADKREGLIWEVPVHLEGARTTGV